MELDLDHYRDTTAVPIHHVMNRRVVSLHERATCKDALHSFLTDGVATLPVVNDAGELAGILSETDLLVEANIHKTVSELCTRHVVSVTENCTIEKAIRLFQARRLRCIPVVDARLRLVGVVSRKDILAHYANRPSRP